MSIEILPISEVHIESFRAALDVVARERMYLAQPEAPPIEIVRSFVLDNIAADVAQFVAIEDALVVGWCDILPVWAPALRHRGTLGMGVISSHRGRGIGRRLLAACLEKARANGITRVQLEVRSDNVSAISLYKSVGFIEEASVRKAMRVDGKYYDAIQMSLLW